MKISKWVRVVGIATMAAAGSASAIDHAIDISVKGMVCSFCAQGIEKKFRAEDAVSAVKVKLEDHRVSLALKEGRTLDDAALERILKDAGYSIEKIERK